MTITVISRRRKTCGREIKSIARGYTAGRLWQQNSKEWNLPPGFKF